MTFLYTCLEVESVFSQGTAALERNLHRAVFPRNLPKLYLTVHVSDYTNALTLNGMQFVSEGLAGKMVSSAGCIWV